MSKICPKCGKELEDGSHFCNDCGYNFQGDTNSSESLSNLSTYGKVFIVLIAFIVVVGALFVFSIGMNSNAPVSTPATVSDDSVEHVELTITQVSGYKYDYENDTIYDLMTSALFTKLPSDYDGYIVKTSYYDANGKLISHVTETLSSIIYDDEDAGQYPFGFGFADTHKKPNPDHATVEIIKNGKTIDNYTFEVDQSDIDF